MHIGIYHAWCRIIRHYKCTHYSNGIIVYRYRLTGQYDTFHSGKCFNISGVQCLEQYCLFFIQIYRRHALIRSSWWVNWSNEGEVCLLLVRVCFMFQLNGICSHQAHSTHSHTHLILREIGISHSMCTWFACYNHKNVIQIGHPYQLNVIFCLAYLRILTQHMWLSLKPRVCASMCG